jgi:hypothetical protein
MARIYLSLLIILIFASCQQEKEIDLLTPINWEERVAEPANIDNLVEGKTYLPVYSHIYHRFDNREFNLTITISIRNISLSDSIYILNADYYNTEGDKIRQYFKNPSYLKPMETIEIIIEEDDEEGGSGANFVFEWAIKDDKNPPLFEAVMISTYGQQGLSFATRGVQVFD